MTRHRVLAGTGAGRQVAGLLALREDLEVTSSLAGRVQDPRLPVGAVRSGGFGGARGWRGGCG